MGVIRLRPDNLIPRPWGGFRLAAFKGLPDGPRPIGESFEVSAFPDDAEAGAHPSIAIQPDGTERPLPDLLRDSAEPILGSALLDRSGHVLPLLPKFLDVGSLLSVQAHPPGHAECYVVLAADPGATLRLGFRTRVDAPALIQRCRAGRAAQERLLETLGSGVDQEALHARLAPALGDRRGGPDACRRAIEPFLAAADLRDGCVPLLSDLFDTYWAMLDAMHEIPVAPGDVILNATPARLRRGGPCSAEVHALGNPEQREILLLEIRKPGPTFRLWDHARFPLRPLQIEEAVAALNVEPTDAREFVAGRLPLAPAGEVRTLAECPDFIVEYVRVGPLRPGWLETRGGPFTLHVIEGSAAMRTGREEIIVRRGESVLVPAAAGGCEIRGAAGPAGVVAARVAIPPAA